MSGPSTAAWEMAAESLGLEPAPRVRPNPALWIWYVFWGPLPRRHAIWVLYDTTCSAWVVRHVTRILAAVAVPVAAILLFLPADASLRALTAAVTGACAVLLTVVWVNESTDHRLVQAGYAYNVGPAVRAKRAEIAQRLRTW